MQKKIDDTIERLNGMEVNGYPVRGMEVRGYHADGVEFCISLESPVGLRFKLIALVSNKAIENDKFDLYEFMTEKIKSAVRMIDKHYLTDKNYSTIRTE